MWSSCEWVGEGKVDGDGTGRGCVDLVLVERMPLRI